MQSTVILVEGESDRNAVIAASRLLGRDLEGVAVVAMGGSAGFVDRIPETVDSGAYVSGLYDQPEAKDVVRGLSAVGIALDGRSLSEFGFFECVADLEDELIRANGIDRILEVFDEQDEGRKFEKFQTQLEWRGRPLNDQIHRFLGIKAGRKVRYGGLLVESLEPDHLPQPLVDLVSRV